ncbi:MAG: HlyD family efflux transporter periplasmic adaptor subunit [Bacillota bacterium]|nr:HlyD family efflux transporter periplasmic adaptor subunit [Bacillota bacterium]
MKATGERKRRRWPYIVGLILAVVLTGIFLAGRAIRSAWTDGLVTWQTAAVTREDLTVIVYGSGVLEAQISETILAPYSAGVDRVLAEPGDLVRQGDVLALLDASALDQKIDQLIEQMETLDRQIVQAAIATGSSRITAPVAGRIKQIYAAEGMPVQAVMDEWRALIALSVDGYLVLEFDIQATGEGRRPGDPVTVKAGDVVVDGHIERYVDRTVVVLIPDDQMDAGLTADVYDQADNKMGSAEVRINKPVYVTGRSGIISEIRRDLNERVSKGSTLFVLSETALSADYLDLIDQRNESLEQWRDLMGRREQLTIAAPIDGVVSRVTIQENNSVQENQEMIEIEANDAFQIRIMIDELDITDVAIGQMAEVSLAARNYTAYPAHVTRISTVGTTSGGVTTYPVTLTMDETDGLFSGLSAGVDILVGQKEAVLAIPVAALKVDGSSTYVTRILTDERGRQTAEDIDVTIGLVNGNWAEILSGLQEDDLVAIQQTGTQTGMPNFGFRTR